MITSILALLVMQVGPNPAMGAIPDVPEELRDRPTREQADAQAAPSPRSDYLSQCLSLANSEPEDALDFAQSWRVQVESDLELAQSAHCLGLAMVRLERFAEAREVLEVASAEAPEELPAYRARLAAMAGNAALADGKPATAEPLFAQAVAHATAAADGALAAGLHVDRARALVAAERPEEAVEVLAAARVADPTSARAWLLSATLSRRLDRLGEAQEQIERAAGIDPRDPAIGLEAGVIAALSGRGEDARRSFESVLLVAPDSDEANRARAYLEQLAQ
ncbi:tetratricopeptide repeat protein [Qipengyuania sp. XHP0207]|uniref:tetratricopeptide repeat protein n=1 Tax=Qipengyuania sp. XHP0207 TaxID=3038078 RepID=UPI00241BEFA2|nr:tetratricopeptide repeat protein [Qipengyuania sp. XHP0207]MDG5747958.1 tetratricopeptide repeat protein [Qipengyuania sp. XHP0207]